MPQSDPIVRLKKVQKRFGTLEVLQGIDLDVPPSATVALIGPSGSGKSTLVRCINHLERIQGGSIRVRDVARFRTGIGMVFQSFNLFPHLTVLGNIIEAPCGVLRWPPDEAVEKARALLRQVDLAEKEDVYPATLSGGQQQRVAIVRALIMDPAVMLFDEPTSALDPELTGEVLRVIRDLAIDGRTAIIVTHELRFAREVASHVVFMDRGLVVEQGPPGEVLGDPREERTRAFIRQVFQ